MHVRHGYALSAFALALVLNPGYFAACVVESTPDFKYGAAEMEALVLAANDSFEFERDGVHYRADVEIAPADGAGQERANAALFAATAHACGNRKLMSTAAACIDSSSMGVAGRFTLLRSDDGIDYEVVASDVRFGGELYVGSLNLTTGNLYLDFEGGHLGLNSPDGKSFDLTSNDISALLP